MDSELRKVMRDLYNNPVYGVLGPDAWRQLQLKRLREFTGPALVELPTPSPAIVHMEPGYRTLDADVSAYRARAQAMVDELAGMLSKLRIVSKVRLVVDNTREVQL